MKLELLALGFSVSASWVLQWHKTSSKLGKSFDFGGNFRCRQYNSHQFCYFTSVWCIDDAYVDLLGLVVRCDVTVWNRTKSKCDPLVGIGAK